jgi:hypothetical protein
LMMRRRACIVSDMAKSLEVCFGISLPFYSYVYKIFVPLI